MTYRRRLVSSAALGAIGGLLLVSDIDFAYRRTVVLGLFTAALAMLSASIISLRHHRHGRVLLRRAALAYAPHLGMGILLLLGLRIALVLAPPTDSPLAVLDAGETRTCIDRDAARLDGLDARVGPTLAALEAAVAAGTSTTNRLRRLDHAWDNLLDLARDYEQIAAFYQGFHTIDYLAEPALHADAFAVAMRAFVQEYLLAHMAAGLLERHEAEQMRLNQANPKRERGSFERMRDLLIDDRTLLRLVAGRLYLSQVREDVSLGQDALARLENSLSTSFAWIDEEPLRRMRDPLRKLRHTQAWRWLAGEVLER